MWRKVHRMEIDVILLISCKISLVTLVFMTLIHPAYCFILIPSNKQEFKGGIRTRQIEKWKRVGQLVKKIEITLFFPLEGNSLFTASHWIRTIKNTCIPFIEAGIFSLSSCQKVVLLRICHFPKQGFLFLEVHLASLVLLRNKSFLKRQLHVVLRP
jgi:hypothetical protein